MYKRQVQPEKIEVNRNEKKNLCDWLCANGTKEDFEGFDIVLDIIADIAGLPRKHPKVPKLEASDTTTEPEAVASSVDESSDEVADTGGQPE